MLFNRYAAPFHFLVTDLPDDYCEWLVVTGTHEVKSHLGVLFIQNGIPIPHDYVVTLTNYNMRTDSEMLRERAHQLVRWSIINLLFDKPSDTSLRIEVFINQCRDNVDETLTNEQAKLVIRDSIRVSSLDVTVPGTKITTTVYNVYIHPPTTNQTTLTRWRDWISSQKFHAGISGVGVKYQHPWRCLHCKTIDHPSGLCTLTKSIKGKEAKQTEPPTAIEELLPLEPTPGPSRRPRTQTPGPPQNTKGKGREPSAPTKTKKSGAPTKAKPKSVRTTGPKKRKVN
jgi:hypothetical protein